MTVPETSTNTAVRPWQLQYEPALDGLRGLSIIGVVLFHASAVSGVRMFAGGFIGVSVFFTLSGFLIAGLLMRQRSAGAGIDWANFWARRLKRLAPAATVVVIAVVVISATTDLLAAHPSDVVASLWSFTNWHVIIDGQAHLLRTIVGPLGPTWSLSVEEQFYLLIVIAAWFAVSRAVGRRALLGIAAALWVSSVLIALLASPWSPRLEFGTDVRLGEFVAGVALALWWSSPERRHVSARLGDVAAFGGLTCIVVLILVGGHVQRVLLRGGYPVLGLVSAVTVAGLLSHGRAERMMRWSPIVRVGTLSYSLYLVHWPVMLVLDSGRVGFSGIRLVLVQLAVSAVLACALHAAVEAPVRRMALPSNLVAILAWVAASAVISILAAATLS